MQNSFDRYLNVALVKRDLDNAFRRLSPDSNLIDFCSNDYLGFARSERLKETIDNELVNHSGYKLGSTGSRLIAGNADYTEMVEQQIANFHKAEAGLIFNSGYDANLGVFSSFPQRTDTIIYDELIHASIRDGIRLSWSDSYSFKHNDIKDLQFKLSKAKGRIFVAIESVYSMDGDFAPLKEIADLCERFSACLIVDEAHATGVYGANGEGLVVALGLEEKVYARIHTFGKAMGVHGAIVVGTNTMRNYLINFARSFIYTTALPIHSIASIKSAYDLLYKSEYERVSLNNLITHFKQKANTIKGAFFLSDETPIQSLVLPGNNVVKEIAQYIRKGGFDVRAIMSPTVPKGKERIRLCLHAFNTKEQIDELVYLLALQAEMHKD